MCEIEISILPDGRILISRSIREENNKVMLDLLQHIIKDPVSLKLFLNNGKYCEQIIGEEPLCG